MGGASRTLWPHAPQSSRQGDILAQWELVTNQAPGRIAPGERSGMIPPKRDCAPIAPIAGGLNPLAGRCSICADYPPSILGSQNIPCCR